MPAPGGAALVSTGQLDLSAAETVAIEQALIALCPHWDLQQTRLEAFLSGGYSNRNYRLSHNQETYVLRLPAATSSTDFGAEHAMLQQLAGVFQQSTGQEFDVDTQVAEVIAAHAESGRLLSRWVDAPVLARVAGVTGKQLGHYLAALHSQLQKVPAAALALSATPPDSELVRSILLNLQVAFAQSDEWPDRQNHCATHLAGLVKNTTAPCLSHIDLNPWNLLFDSAQSPPRWTTLDWETLAFAPAAFDLVALSDGYAFNHSFSQAATTTLAEQTCDAYNAALANTAGSSTLGAHELTQMRELFWWREYAWAAARLSQGELRPAIVAQVHNQRHHYATLLAPRARALGLTLVNPAVVA